MPANRREILRLGLGSSTLLACGATVPTFLAGSARALADQPASTTKGRILVVVQLDGGNDGLNTVVPHRDDEYRRRRPTLHVPSKDVLSIDDRVGFHPALDAFAKLLQKEQLAVIQSVGYPNPNRSHFESMAIWQTAQLEPNGATTGWLARALDRRSADGGSDAPGLHIDGQFPLPQALSGGQHAIPSLAGLEQFRRRLGLSDISGAADQRAALDRLAQQHRGEPGSLLQFVERSTLISYASSARLEGLTKASSASTGYPQFYGLARRLRLIAQLIKAGLSTTIYYAHLDGFDTHANQQANHPNLLRELGSSLRAFLDDLEKSGEADRVLVLVFSEFGRRLAENASGGTDHGTAAPVFVLGRPVHPGLLGPYPNLSDLQDGDPRHAIDFRRVYASLLERWLGLSSREVLGEAFEPLSLLRG
jgi:uncharacterized protein (DUF1501 family)